MTHTSPSRRKPKPRRKLHPAALSKMLISDLRRAGRWMEATGQPAESIDQVLVAIVDEHDGAFRNGWETGRLIGFTRAGYRAFGANAYGPGKPRFPRVLRPIDATPEELREDRMAQHRPARAAREAQRRAEARARAKTAADLDDRASAILTVLTADRWHTAKTLMHALARCTAFRTPDGRRFLKGNSLRVAILRTLKAAPLNAMIEVTERREKHGLPVIRVRRKGPENGPSNGRVTGFCHSAL
jgi:hypothetical protein